MSSRWDDELFRAQVPAQPPVIGPERAGQEAGQEPQEAYVLGAEWQPGDGDFLVELRELADGPVALLAYSSPESLAECCGERQPWGLVPVPELDELMRRSMASVVLWDETLPPEQRRD